MIPHHQVWTYNNLERYIDSNVAQDLFQNYIKKEIHDIILDVSQRNAKISQHIDGCFELYGADIGKYHPRLVSLVSENQSHFILFF